MSKENITKEDITKELRQIREGGITVRAMAQLLGITESAVHGWLRGESEPRASQMATLKAFGK